MAHSRKLAPMLARTSIGFTLLLFAAVALTDVVLHPGTIQGTIGVGTTAIGGGQVWVPMWTQPYDGYAVFNGDTFTVTVEGDRTYPSIFVRARVPLGTYDLWSTAPYWVPIGGTAALDFTRPSGTIQIVPRVTGGTVTSTSVTASSSDPVLQETHTMAVSSDGPSGVTFPMVPGTVTIGGEAVVTVEDPIQGAICSATVPFALPTPGSTVELGAGELVAQDVPLTVTAGDCVTGLTGRLELSPLPGGAVPTTWNVTLFGSTDGSYRWQAVPGNGNSYLFTGITPGEYYVSPLCTSYPGNDTTKLPTWSLHVPDFDPMNVEVLFGQITERDFVFDTAEVHGSVIATGSAARFATFGEMYIHGSSASLLTAGGMAEAYGHPPDFTFSAALTPGSWIPNQTIMVFEEPVGPLPWTSLVQVTDALAAPFTVAAGDVATLAPSVLDVTEAQVVFDVIEPPGTPTIGISYPRIWIQTWDPSASRVVMVSAYAIIQNAPTPSVRVVGPPGTYPFDAFARVLGTEAKFPSSTIILGRRVNTPAGPDVSVTPVDSSGNPLPMTVRFCYVTTGGDTTASLVGVGPAAPLDHSFVPIVPGSTYLDLVTTADYALGCGGIEIAVHYDPAALGLTPAQEASLKLQQWVCDGGSCAWQVINGSLDGLPNPDLTNHVVYGVTSRLGLVALTLPDVVPVPPAETCVGEPDTAAQLTTDPGVCTVTVDNDNKRAGGCSGGGGGLLSCTFDGQDAEALGLGWHGVLVVGTAADGSIASCTSFVDVVDREKPQIACEPVPPVECTGPTTALALSASCTDNCAQCVAQCGGGPFAVGATPVACNATDASGNVSTCWVDVTVQDTAPPALTVAVSPAVLWPPNHKLVPIDVQALASDGCDPAPSVSCTASSSEPALMLGSGETVPDIVWSNGKLLLRAERSGLGTGRVYTVTCTARDASGNTRSASATVSVPHDEAL